VDEDDLSTEQVKEMLAIGGGDLVVEEDVTMQVETDPTTNWYYFDHILAFESMFIIGLNNDLVLVFIRFFQFGPTFYFVFNLVIIFVNFIQFGLFQHR